MATVPVWNIIYVVVRTPRSMRLLPCMPESQDVGEDCEATHSEKVTKDLYMIY